MITELREILLAEDDPKDVELTLAALAEHNLANAVTVVNDGVQALAYLRREGAFAERTSGPPAVVLLDVKMPRMDGLQVLSAMRSDPALRAVPVVMLTSSRQESDLVESYRLGVNGFVVKPVSFPDFIEAVRAAGFFWALVNVPPPR